MLIDILQTAARKRTTRSFTSTLAHLGALGLFSLAILDSLPLPTFGGPDILTAILAARHHNLWFEYAAVATMGSVIGAFITFRLARKAGLGYLTSHFKSGSTQAMLRVFEKWGTGALAISAAVPFPTPTSLFFAAAGATGYSTRKYLFVVGLCRTVRYTSIAYLARHYGSHFTRIIRHPVQYWGWFLLIALVIAGLAVTGIMVTKRIETASNTG
jgi:membrane protein YqaA with SNARE-associated domain